MQWVLKSTETDMRAKTPAGSQRSMVSPWAHRVRSTITFFYLRLFLTASLGDIWLYWLASGDVPLPLPPCSWLATLLSFLDSASENPLTWFLYHFPLSRQHEIVISDTKSTRSRKTAISTLLLRSPKELHITVLRYINHTTLMKINSVESASHFISSLLKSL